MRTTKALPGGHGWTNWGIGGMWAPRGWVVDGDSYLHPVMCVALGT